jgi:preprotein translocase subunit SecA
MNKQRQAVYSMRRQLLEGSNQKERILEIIRGIIASFAEQFCPEAVRQDQYDLTGLQTAVLNQFGVKIEIDQLAGFNSREIEQQVDDLVIARYEDKEKMIGSENLRQAERIIMLNVVDNQWKDHLLSMDHLKEGIGLRGYGQKDPLIEYKKESFIMFQDMMDRIEDETIKFLFFMRVEFGGPSEGGDGFGGNVPLPYPTNEEEGDEEAEAESEPELVAANVQAQQREAQQSVLDLTRNIQKKKDREMAGLQFTGGDGTGVKQPVSNKGPKVGRNEMCPCGSGKKYKKCCGATS